MGLPKHLSAEAIEEFGREVDAIRNEVMASRGERDRKYLLRLIRVQRSLDIGGRFVMIASVLFAPGAPWLRHAGWPAFVLVLGLGAAMLALAKILENMEIGHNVMHAQWDWMRDPSIQSSTWEWDSVCPSDLWKHSHNVVHHTWTNVVGMDPDVGYGILRVTPRQAWSPRHLIAPISNLLLMLFFEWGVAAHDIEVEKIFSGEKPHGAARPILRRIAWKASRQMLKDFVLWPALAAGASWLVAGASGHAGAGLAGFVFASVALANVAANAIRNVWANLIIFCGHFAEGVHHFTVADVEGETRGGWYVRQLLGSCNIGGGRLFHVLSGNLSHQIEHHLFPDMPSNRYPEVAPRVQALAARYGLPYNTGSLRRQFGTTTWTIWKLALPGRKTAPALT
jgi:linoleoyl-CoA desaturase